MFIGLLAQRITVWSFVRVRLVVILLFTLAPLALCVESPQSVFVRSQCDGKITSAALSSFKESVRTSQNYQLVPTLENEGRPGSVLAVYIVCTERTNYAAVAITYGRGKCRPGATCGVIIDGSSLKVALCDAYAAADCGKAIFRTFDEYNKRSSPATGESPPTAQ
jgi:hypothetical protein